MILIYLNCTSNLYHEFISQNNFHFFSVQRRNSGKKYANFFAREEDSMTPVDSNFNFLCGRPHGAGPPPPSTCVHLSLTPSPFRVDVINGWPLRAYDSKMAYLFSPQPL